MSALDILLQADAKKINELPTKKIKMDRLTKLFKKDFYVTIKAISSHEYSQIQRQVIVKKGKSTDVDNEQFFQLSLLKGIADPKLNDTALMEHLGVRTPEDVINKLFLAGEITHLATEIGKLNGYDILMNEENDLDEEIKKQ